MGSIGRKQGRGRLFFYSILQILTVLIGAVSYVFFSAYTHNFPLAVAVTAGAFALCVIVHEFGHALMARLHRMDLFEFAVRPLSLTWTANVWRVRWIGRGPYAGYIRAAPRELPGAVVASQWCILGGPIASFALAALGIAGAGFLGFDWKTGQPSILGWAMLFLAAWSFTFGLLCSVPTPEGYLPNDADLLHRLKGDRALIAVAMDVIQNRHAAETLEQESTRPWIDLLLREGPEDEQWFFSRTYGYDWAVAVSDLPLAHRCLGELSEHLDLVPDAYRVRVRYEAAYFQARFMSDPAKAQEIMLTAEKTAGERAYFSQRAEAALLWSQQDPRAPAKAVEAIALMNDDHRRNEVDVKWLLTLAAQLPSPAAPPTP